MKLIVFFLFIIFNNMLICSAEEDDKFTSDEQCSYNIYRGCNQDQKFTQKEIDTAGKWIQNIILNSNYPLKPDKPPCTKFNIRKDFKCLRQNEKNKLARVLKILYKDGTMTSFADYHERYWPAWHKTLEFLASHRTFLRLFEKRMQAIDPSVFIPYWGPYLYGANPELSSLWDYLGTSGNYSTGYCVNDGIFTNENIVPCLKRHWNDDGTINKWTTLEIENLIKFTNVRNFQFQEFHFQVHLNIGGYEGHQAVKTAPYDFNFFMWHIYVIEISAQKMLLAKMLNLYPLTPIFKYCFDQQTGQLKNSNILTDTITGYPNITLSENLFLGFGDFCTIPDVYIKPINRLVRGEREPVPTAIKRMPKSVLEKWAPEWIPHINRGNLSFLMHTFEEVGNCNRKCCPLPKPTYINETVIGRRQLAVLKYDNNFDETAWVENGTKTLINAWNDLHDAGYCSPYVIC